MMEASKFVELIKGIGFHLKKKEKQTGSAYSRAEKRNLMEIRAFVGSHKKYKI
jgi:hypothetical protein